MAELKRIVILGGGTAGWMAANLMQQRWPDFSISLVEAPDISTIGVGEGSTPTLKRFFKQLNIAESEWMPRCHATYKVNISFKGWSPASGIDSYSHPFISQLDTFTEKAFLVNCTTRRLGLAVETQPHKFFVNGQLAQEHKAPLVPGHFPFRMEYGYHFDSGLLGEFLAERACAAGVQRIKARVQSAQLNSAGEISQLLCEGRAPIAGDLFIDCSGFNGFLIQQALGVSFEPFTQLLNDSAVVIATAADAALPVETLSKAQSHGWRWRIPLSHRTGNGYVYSARMQSADAAETELRRELNLLDADVPARHLTMRVGQVAQHWAKNCVALGLAQGFIEPLEATALHLVQIAIEMFMDDWEAGQFSAAQRDSYNSKIHERFERVRDYIIAHYKLNTRDDSDYWRVNRNNRDLPESLLQLLDVWYRCGDLSQEIQRQKIQNHFSTLSWHCLLAGYGAFPPLATKQPGRGDLYREQEIQDFIERCARNFPLQSQALQNQVLQSQMLAIQSAHSLAKTSNT